MEQLILTADGNYAELDGYIKRSGIKSAMLVCGDSLRFLNIKKYFDTAEERLGIRIAKFSGFKPNPDYASVEEGVRCFKENGCEMIIAVGGGSAMDVAKCVKLFSNMKSGINYLEQKIIPNGVKLIAVPTTAGTGSEATRFAVIYYKGEKQSVTHESCIPEAVLFDESVLVSLPEYQKKSTLLDALCHGIESFWSVNSTEESKKISEKAIKSIISYKDGYFKGENNYEMLEAANIAGKAINITQTTAAHAMCYKLTSLYGIAHGHAAALCLAKLWRYMLNNIDKCADPRGKDYLLSVFDELAGVFGADSPEKAADLFEKFFDALGLETPGAKPDDIDILKVSVNQERLKNNPVIPDENDIEAIYKEILDIKG